MKKMIYIACLLLGVSSAWAGTVTDDFNREATGMDRSSDPSVVGHNWRNGDLDHSFWGITNNAVDGMLASWDHVLYNDALQTISGDGANFTVSLDVKGNAGGVWVGGVAFNVQDGDNWYGLRFKTGFGYLQFTKTVNGGASVTTLVGDLPNFAADTYYTITVSSSVAGTFNVDIREKGSATAIWTGTKTDHWSPETPLTGGYGGIYVAQAGLNFPALQSFDNFELTADGEPLYGYEPWAATWDVDIGAEGEDYDSDGLINLYEYGMGGDPTNALDQGTASEFVVEAGAVSYIFPQLSDPNSGLDYYLELSSDLAAGTWSNTGYTVTGTNVTVGDLDFVTNALGAAEDKEFIRLRIEQD